MATPRKSPARKAPASKTPAPAKKSATATHKAAASPRTDELAEPAVVAPAKGKRVHGKFSMPKADHALIGELKQLAKRNGQAVRKNELLRAGLRALRAMDALALRVAIAAVRPAAAPAKGKTAKSKGK